MTNVVSVGDLTTESARRRRTDWMRRYDVGEAPAPIERPAVVAYPVPLTGDRPHPIPPVALDLIGPAAAQGWHVELFYSQGQRLGAKGKSLGPGHMISVRAYRFPADRCVLTYVSTQGKDWSAGDGWLFGIGQRPRKVGVAAAKLALTGSAPPEDLTAAELTRPKLEAVKGACETCAALVTINKDGTLRVHGPKDSRCAGRRPIAA